MRACCVCLSMQLWMVVNITRLSTLHKEPVNYVCNCRCVRGCVLRACVLRACVRTWVRAYVLRVRACAGACALDACVHFVVTFEHRTGTACVQCVRACVRARVHACARVRRVCMHACVLARACMRARILFSN